jgi:hypothetical protein
MIQITQSDVIVSNDQQVASLREEFERQSCVIIPKLIAPHLLRRIHEYLERSEFYSKSHAFDDSGEVFAKEFAVRSTEPVVHMFYLLLNRPKLFEVIRQITGCPPIGNFVGRIFRRLPVSDHYDSWHSDNGDYRLIGMSINLGTEVYSGGVFQLRDSSSKQIIRQVANTGFGDACLFRLGPDLEHRVTRVEGQIGRTAGAGWFRSQPDCLSVIKTFFSEPG